MAIVANFKVIQNDAVRRIGDGDQLWQITFNTRGRHQTGQALLMFMVKGLTATTSDVEVKINGMPVGVIENYNGANPGHWFTQIIHVQGRQLINGNNELRIDAVSWPGARGNDRYDDFFIKDVICYFNQQV